MSSYALAQLGQIEVTEDQGEAEANARTRRCGREGGRCNQGRYAVERRSMREREFGQKSRVAGGGRVAGRGCGHRNDFM
jgi:hypothetical protein